MNFLRIALRDISSILKNRFIRVSVVAIIIVPLLYSLLYLDAFWDPYSKLKQMPVAVVNLDRGSIKDDKQVNYGNDIVERLKKNNELGWRFVSEADADKGVKGTKYYAEFVIPEDFSEKVLSAKNGTPQPPQILYAANEKRNFLAAQINGKVELQLKDEIEQTIVKEYTKVVFDNLYDVKDGFKKASDGSGTLKDNLAIARDGSLALKDGIGQARDGVLKATGALGENKALMSLINSKSVASVKGIMNDAAVLKNADTSMLYLIPQFVTGSNIQMAKKLAADAKAVDFKSIINNPLVKQLPALATPQNISSAGKLLNDAETLSKVDTTKLLPMMGLLKNSDKLGGLLNDAKSLSLIDTSSMNTAINAQKASAEQYIAVSGKLNTESNKQALLTAINTNSNLNDMQKAQLNTIVNGYYNLTLQTANGFSQSTGTITAMQDNITKLQAMQKELKDNTQLISGVQQALSPENVKYLSSVLPQLIDMKSDLDANQKNIATLKLLLAKTGDPSVKETIAKLTVLQSDIQKVMPLVDKMNSSMTPETLNKLQQSPQLVSQLLGMQKDLKNNGKILEVASNALSDKNIRMANSLIGAIPSLTDGVNKLYDGSVKLSDGMTKLTDGATELNSKLGDGYDKINKNLVNSSDTMASFVSQPLTMNAQPVNSVKNYGTGFTPYFIPLSLWVGTIMMFFIITDKVDDDIKAKPSAVVAGKFLSYGFIGIMQALLASIVVLTLGLKPNSIVLFFLFNVLMSFVFIAIIQSLIFLLGQAGRLLSIVLLIMQLTSCAGTFPLELTPKLFKVLNPYMPFTYCVTALREIIAGSDYLVVARCAGILAAIMVVFLIISMIMKGRADRFQEKFEDMKVGSIA